MACRLWEADCGKPPWEAFASVGSMQSATVGSRMWEADCLLVSASTSPLGAARGGNPRGNAADCLLGCNAQRSAELETSSKARREAVTSVALRLLPFPPPRPPLVRCAVHSAPSSPSMRPAPQASVSV